MPNSLIDYDRMSPADLEKLEGTPYEAAPGISRGMFAGMTRAVHSAAGMSIAGKPKRKQAGREPTQLESQFEIQCRVAKGNALLGNYWVKPFILRIGPDMTFEPDFMVTGINSAFTWVIDTKGPHCWEDSRIKIKVAAEKYPMWRWLIVTRQGGIWRAKEVTAAKGIERRFTDLAWLK